jgi:hypothetical protein
MIYCIMYLLRTTLYLFMLGILSILFESLIFRRSITKANKKMKLLFIFTISLYSAVIDEDGKHSTFREHFAQVFSTIEQYINQAGTTFNYKMK